MKVSQEKSKTMPMQTFGGQEVHYGFVQEENSSLNKCLRASLSNRYNMNLTHSVLAAVDLAEVFYNMRMLRTCFKDKTENTLLQLKEAEC